VLELKRLKKISTTTGKIGDSPSKEVAKLGLKVYFLQKSSSFSKTYRLTTYCYEFLMEEIYQIL
jgi:hypothetical protein